MTQYSLRVRNEEIKTMLPNNFFGQIVSEENLIFSIFRFFFFFHFENIVRGLSAKNQFLNNK